MKAWHVALIGAVVGPLAGIPLLECASVPYKHPLIYPVTWSMVFLSDIFMPGKDMAGLVLFLPLIVLYCAGVGALVALTARYLLRKLLVWL
jgi:hypothetical protein